MVRHNLDVMHIEKNVCESLISMLLNVKGKSKDSLSSRLDMVELGIRTTLAPIEKDSRMYLPPSCYTMSRKEKQNFCQFIKDLKVPEGYSSNLRSKVNMQELKLQNMKSHDCHVLMQQILPVALRGNLQKEVGIAITKLCYFFNKLCSKVVDPSILDDLQMHIVETLCSLEMYFPPSFFDVMVHLVVHLVREVKICGPVFLRWMYPFERFMRTLKSMVRSKSRPEACIIECYVAEEAVVFCSEYVAKANVIGLSVPKNIYGETGRGLFGPKMLFVPSDELNIAHLYVLRNMAIIQQYVEKHFAFIKESFPSKFRTEVSLQNYHTKSFASWLQNHIDEEIQCGSSIDDTLRWLSHMPQTRELSYEGYLINGFRFHTMQRDNMQISQNSGVTLVAESYHVSSMKDANPILSSTSYFGMIQEIWELDYIKFRIPVFKCRWFDPTGLKIDDLGLTFIDSNKIGFKNDPFILATQARQIFYVNDGSNTAQKIVLARNSRFMPEGNSIGEDDMELGTFTKLLIPCSLTDAYDEPNWLGNGEMQLIEESRKT